MNGYPQSYSTVKSRLDRWKQYEHDGVLLEEIPFNQVLSTNVEEFLTAYQNPNTRESYRLALSAMYTWSIEKEAELAEVEGREPRWTRNPASMVKGGTRISRVTVPTEAQIHALLTVAEPYQEAYVRAFVHLGLREGELIHTRLRNDLDLGEWQWRIQARLKDPRCTCPQCRLEPGQTLKDKGWSPKNSRGHRTLHVPERPGGLRKAVLRMLDLYPAAPGDFVFRNPRTGRVWVPRSLQEDFAGLCRRADVPYGRDVDREGAIVLHDLRHACATNLVRRGVRESKIAAILGDTVDTVVKTYLNLNAHDLGEGVSQGPAFDLEGEDDR